MRVMFIATGKHTVADGGEEFEFDNSAGNAFPDFKNTRVLPDSCGSFICGKFPHLFKQVDDIPGTHRPAPSFDAPADGFIRLRPTNKPVAPVSEPVVDAVAPVQPAQNASESLQSAVNITPGQIEPPEPKSRIYAKQKQAKG